MRAILASTYTSVSTETITRLWSTPSDRPRALDLEKSPITCCRLDTVHLNNVLAPCPDSVDNQNTFTLLLRTRCIKCVG